MHSHTTNRCWALRAHHINIRIILYLSRGLCLPLFHSISSPPTSSWIETENDFHCDSRCNAFGCSPWIQKKYRKVLAAFGETGVGGFDIDLIAKWATDHTTSVDHIGRDCDMNSLVWIENVIIFTFLSPKTIAAVAYGQWQFNLWKSCRWIILISFPIVCQCPSVSLSLYSLRSGTAFIYSAAIAHSVLFHFAIPWHFCSIQFVH